MFGRQKKFGPTHDFHGGHLSNNGEETGVRSQTTLRAIALIVLGAGAIASLGFMFRTGHNERSPLLIAMFTGWVLAPFAELLFAECRLARRWPARTTTKLRYGMIIVPTVSVLYYSGSIPMPEGSRPAAVYLLVPLASLLVIGAGLLVRAVASRRQ